MTFPFTFTCIPLLGQASGAGFILLSDGEKLVAPDGYSFYLVEKGSSLFFSDMPDAIAPVLDANKPIFVTKDGIDYVVSLVSMRALLLPTLLSQKSMMTNTRSVNTTYLNNTGYGIKISVAGSFSDFAGKLSIICDTNPTPTLLIVTNSVENALWLVSVTAFIPNQHYYRVSATGGTFVAQTWSESTFFGG